MFVLDAVAGAQRVAGRADGTRANGHMVGGEALRLGAARAGARIGALLVDAGAVQRAVGVAEALGPAADVRIAVVFGQALADGVCRVLDAAARVGAAWRRQTGIGGRSGRLFGDGDICGLCRIVFSLRRIKYVSSNYQLNSTYKYIRFILRSTAKIFFWQCKNS